jgi:hypothetical protein
MKIAYLILAHGHLEHLARIVNSLASHDTAFFIHMDARLEVSYETMRNWFLNETEVYFIQQQVQINWGGFSMVQGMLKLFNPFDPSV